MKTTGSLLRKKYIWLPAVLTVYFLFMTFRFGIRLLEHGESLKFWLTAGSETAVIIALYFVLKRRQEYRERREADVNRDLPGNVNQENNNGN